MMDVMRHSNSFSIVNADSCNDDADQTLVLIVLNYVLPRFTPTLWHQVQLRVCADGGANRIFDELPTLIPNEAPDLVRRRFRPDVIIGDLDSIRPEVREFYQNLGTCIVDESYDQDSTDFEKSIKKVTNIPDLQIPKNAGSITLAVPERMYNPTNPTFEPSV